MTEHVPEVDHYGSEYGNFATRLYAEIRGESYDEDIGQNGWLTAAEQDRLIEWLALGSEDRLLDVACGSGGPTLRIAEVSGCTVDGVDIHADAIRTAEEEATARGLVSRATFRRADGNAPLPFAAGVFDGVICVDAINHFPDRPTVLAEWYRVLKPGGRLVFTDPIVVTGPLTHEEIAIRASIGFYLFVPPGIDDEMLASAGFTVRHREDRTANMEEMAARRGRARARREAALREIEGDSNFDGQQQFFEVCARLARERRLSRVAYGAVKSAKERQPS